MFNLWLQPKCCSIQELSLCNSGSCERCVFSQVGGGGIFPGVFTSGFIQGVALLIVKALLQVQGSTVSIAHLLGASKK